MCLMLNSILYLRVSASFWIELFQLNMLFVMMMIEEMGTVLIEEAVTCLLIKEAMIVVDDPQVHTVEIGVVLTTAVDLIRVLELNQEEVPITIEIEAQSVMDIRGIPHVCRL